MVIAIYCANQRLALGWRVMVVVVLLLTACEKGKNPRDQQNLKPEKALLIYPNQNEACLSGKVVSTTRSEVSFSWARAQYAESYEIHVKNLLSGEVLKRNTTMLTLVVDLERNTPYTWSVVSKRGGNIAESESWKFYNAGAGIFYYAPFPADQLSPVAGQTLAAVGGKITLAWEGSDVDNDIIDYDVYFGTTTNPPIYRTNITEKKLTDVAVSAITTYYWRIVTKDAKGNTSDSGICHFKVN